MVHNPRNHCDSVDFLFSGYQVISYSKADTMKYVTKRCFLFSTFSYFPEILQSSIFYHWHIEHCDFDICDLFNTIGAIEFIRIYPKQFKEVLRKTNLSFYFFFMQKTSLMYISVYLHPSLILQSTK